MPSRSLADDLRARSDDELAALLVARPDLARPAPADLPALAARAASGPSARRVVERLDRGLLQTLQAVVVAEDAVGHATEQTVATLLGAPAGDRPAHLGAPAVLWRSAQGRQVVRAAAEALGPHPAGLCIRATEVPARQPAAAPPLDRLGELLADAPASARAILDRLTWGPPLASVPATGPAREGADWLLGTGLVAPSGVGHVCLVREVALALRSGRLHRDPQLEPPDLDGTQLEQTQVDRAGGAAARDLLSHVEELAARWSRTPPRVLRSGGLGVRDLALVARQLDVDSGYAAWLVHLLHDARLIADDGDPDAPVWAPTGDLDTWSGRPAADRWAVLAQAWLGGTRAAYLVGGRASGSAVTALSPETQWPPVRAHRTDVLDELAGLEPGWAPTPATLLARIAWRRPLRDPETGARSGAAVLQEADWLGVTGLGALTSAGRVLRDGGDLVAAAEAQLPAAVDHVLLQADLTAIAPGPLDGELGRFMRLVSDVESRGGATVLRFSAESVRRAFDAGWVADDVLARLAESSRTPVPQPLDYLVRDVARRHGLTRVGGATAYLRSDDEAVLAAMLADRALAPALLRRIAPTVLVSRAEPGVLVDLLRSAGYAPAHEAFDGTLVVAEATARRARPRRNTIAREPVTTVVDTALARSVVTALRAAPPRPAAGASAAAVLAGDPADVAALLRRASSDAMAVWIGYADGNGRTTRHLVRPVRIDGGRVYAVSGESDAEQVYLLHRITGAAPS